MTNDIDIKLIGDKELMQALQSLDYATQQKTLKAILTNASTKAVKPLIKRATPVGQTGNLRKSIGNVRGKSKSVATLFVGPRMSHKRTAEGKEGYRGWVANILENAKGKDRTPEKAKAFKPFSGGTGGPEFFKKVGPIRKRTHLTWAVKASLKPAEVYITKATRTVLERAWKKKTKTGLAGYAEAKGR